MERFGTRLGGSAAWWVRARKPCVGGGLGWNLASSEFLVFSWDLPQGRYKCTGMTANQY